MQPRHGLSQSEGGPLARAVGASVVPKRRGPSCQGGEGRPWSQSERGPHAHAVRAAAVAKGRRPPRPCIEGLGGLKAK